MKAKLHVHIQRGKKEGKRGSTATVLRIMLQVNPETDKHSPEVLKFTCLDPLTYWGNKMNVSCLIGQWMWVSLDKKMPCAPIQNSCNDHIILQVRDRRLGGRPLYLDCDFFFSPLDCSLKK